MIRGNLYFLVARNRDTNKFQIVPTSDTYGSTLEEIDLFTTQFDSDADLMKKIEEKDGQFDFFIAYQKKEKGEAVLHTKEVLYASEGRIRKIAEASKDGKIDHVKQDITDIFHDFCNQMRHQQSFYNMVLYGHTNLYTKFKDYFLNQRYLNSAFLKYKDGGWILKSYSLVRSMLETFRIFYSDSKGEHYKEDSRYRKLLEKDLLKVTAKGYDPNQISLFDFMSEDPLEDSLIQYGLLEKKEVEDINGYAKRKQGEGTR